MKNSVVVQVLLAFFLLTATSVTGQQDLFKDLFESEEPVFHTTVSPGYDSGTVQVVFSFTHSKLEALEAVVWLKDLGTTITGDGDKKMLTGSLNLYNRRPDTVTVRGLQNFHFYTFGVDFRKPNALSRKFNTAILKGSYRYEYQAPETVSALRQPRPPVNTSTQPPVQQARSPQGSTVPCREPELAVWVEPSGYCGVDNRPAILLQANNFYQEEKWEFSVEVRTESGPWKPLYMDAEVQPVFGRTIRQEALCALKPGLYYARVLAWGPGCITPKIRNIPSLIAVADTEPQSYSYQPEKSVKSPAVQSPSKQMPDSCAVNGRALLAGDKIIGTLELSAYSPCGAYNPYAEVRYIHPGYRDLSVNPVLLAPGRPVSFELQLDSRDLARNVHPVQVVVYARPEPGAEGISLSSFWLRPSEKSPTTANNYAQPERTPAEPREAAPGSRSYTTQGYTPPSASFQEPPAPGATDPGNNPAQEYASSIDETMMEEHFDTVGVSASDPNCTQIQNLKLYYHRAEPDKPVFISWLNPRCCQRRGCTYTVWVGPSPDKLRLLVEGNKPGANISELLQGLQPDDSYYEVVVETDNGNRKAGYIMGEGPIYGYEAIIAYRDRFDPPSSDPIGGPLKTTAQNEAKGTEPTAAETNGSISGKGAVPPQDNTGSPGFRWNGQDETATAAKPQQTALVNETPELKTPSLPIEQFDPCRYRREMTVKGDLVKEPGEEVTLSYDHSRQGYRYTLYYQPEGNGSWGIAPGTRELQTSSTFRFQVGPQHNGKYLVLAYKPEKGWGCLSASKAEAVKLQVADAK